MTRAIVLVAASTALAVPGIVAAQPLGAFRWQLQPFCNVITVNVTQQGGVYTLDGYDNQCDGPQRAPLVGLATPNPDGSIGLGLHVVTVPGGRGLQIDARISFPSVNGSWTDSAGNSGTFAFGANTGGSPRPAPTIPSAAIAAGSITAAHLAPGAVGAAQVNLGQVQARVSGGCAPGQPLRSVNADGTVVCADALTTIDGTGGGHTSIAIGTDGLPVISHQGPSGSLRVTQCANPACTRNQSSTTVDDPTNTVGGFTSIAIGADGLPIISHREDPISLRVTHCGNAACSSGSTSTTVDADPNNGVGFYSSIAVGADGLAVISHGTATGELRVTHCGNPACTSGSVSTTVDDPSNHVGGFTSIAIGSDGLPVISHQDQTATALRVTHCGNPACTAGHVSTTISDSGILAGGHTSIAIGVDGLPIISHADAWSAVLRVTHCGNATCTSGNVSTTVDDSETIVGLYTSIAIGVDGLPIISHQAASIGALRVTHCGNIACTAGNRSVTLDDPANPVGSFSSMAIGADGLPVISHRESPPGALRVAKCGTRTCQ